MADSSSKESVPELQISWTKSFSWSYLILQLMHWLLHLVGARDFVTSYLTIKFRASPLWLSHYAMAVLENCLQERSDHQEDFYPSKKLKVRCSRRLGVKVDDPLVEE
jgi:hypothetical protein